MAGFVFSKSAETLVKIFFAHKKTLESRILWRFDILAKWQKFAVLPIMAQSALKQKGTRFI